MVNVIGKMTITRRLMEWTCLKSKMFTPRLTEIDVDKTKNAQSKTQDYKKDYSNRSL